MDLKSEVSSADNSLKSSLDPSTTNVVETPEEEPAENSADYEADPADPDTIDPELINAPSLDAEDDDLTEEEVDPDLDEDAGNPIEPDFDLPSPDEGIPD
ncbi:hypothetical protein [Methylophilus sp. Leaf414]|uniref:hypothetical protein n=1 Tax=Methylophilus sp. Leaf414 TaxID=1736371 RepID=UPI0006F9ADA6|nr:hypothetical protein [Methylophilus sp. Leaf414]KQT38184.1 hypothetical protein ASG24_04315 [Methylophilus sp. Leaf414]